MQLVRTAVVAIVLAACAAPARAGWFEIALNGNAVDASGGNHFGSDPRGRLALGGRLLYDDDDDTKLGSVLAALASEATAVEGLEFGVGAQGYFGTGRDLDVSAIGLGVTASWAPPALDGVYFGARIFYAPGIFAWSDTDDLKDWGVKAGYRVTPKIEIFATFQRIDADFGALGRPPVHEGLLVGFGGRF